MEALLDLVGVRAFAERKAFELPEGQRKLVDIAVALALKPQVLLMDDPDIRRCLVRKTGCHGYSHPRARDAEGQFGVCRA